MDAQELSNELCQFTGTEMYYKHGLNQKVCYTDGVRFFAQNAGGGAYWLLDILATEPEILAQQASFAAITLIVALNMARIVVTDGDEKTVYTRQIDWTDCPDGEWYFYFIGGVILLRSEY